MKKILPRQRGILLSVILFLLVTTTFLFSVVYKISVNIFMTEYISDLEDSVYRLGDSLQVFGDGATLSLQEASGVLPNWKKGPVDFDRFAGKILDKIPASRVIEVLSPSGERIAMRGAPSIGQGMGEELSQMTEQIGTPPAFFGYEGSLYALSQVEVPGRDGSYLLKGIIEMGLPALISPLKEIPMSLVMIRGKGYQAIYGDPATSECTYCHESGVPRGVFTIPHQGFIKKGGFLLSKQVGGNRFAFLPLKETTGYSSYLLIRFDSGEAIGRSVRVGQLIVLAWVLLSFAIIMGTIFLYRRMKEPGSDLGKIEILLESGGDLGEIDPVPDEIRPLVDRVVAFKEELAKSRISSEKRIQELVRELDVNRKIGKDSVSKVKRINEFISRVNAMDYPEKINETMTRDIKKIFPCHLVVYAVRGSGAGEEEGGVYAAHGYRSDSISEIFIGRLKAEFPGYGFALTGPRIISIEDESFFSIYSKYGHGLKSGLIFPIDVKGEKVGVIGFFRKEGSAFTDDDMDFISVLATHLGTAAENSRLHEDVKRNYFNAIKALVNAVEEKDRYTKGHSERVTALAVALGQKAGLSKKKLNILYQAAVLHDVGKIVIDLTLLNKKGTLSEEEMEIVRQHPLIGQRIIEPLSFLGEVKACIKEHHERYDGGGYPSGLGKEELSLEGKILAVADAFDAMTSDRPYRKAMNFEDAIKEIMENSGKQFDPRVVELLLELHEEMRIARRYRSWGG